MYNDMFTFQNVYRVYLSRRIENILEKLCVMFANIQKFDVQYDDKINVLLNAYYLRLSDFEIWYKNIRTNFMT